MSWKEYVKSNIMEFRMYYKRLPEEEKKSIDKNKEAFLLSLNKPSQVVVINLDEPNITHMRG